MSDQSKFDIGDKVVILTEFPAGLDHHPELRIPPGTVGTVMNNMGAVQYYVNNTQEQWAFYDRDLAFYCPHVLMDPEMSLEEIELAQTLMEGMK